MSEDWEAFITRLVPVQPTVATAWAEVQRVRHVWSQATPDEAAAGALPCLEEAALDARLVATRVDPAAARVLAERDLLALEPAAPAARRLAAEVVVAVALLRTNDIEGCLPRLASAERQCRELGTGRLLLHTLTEYARALSQSGEPIKAIELFQEAVTLARRCGDLRAEAQNLCNLGFLFGDRDDPEQYARYTREALALHARFDDPYGRAMVHCNLGGALSRLRQLDEAEVHYRASRALAESQGMRFVQALCLGGEGGVCCERGDWERGRALYDASNALLAELGNRYQICRHHYLLGMYLLRDGQLDEARALLTAAADAGRAGGFGTTLSMALEALALVSERQGDPHGALTYLREHLATQKRVVETAIDDRVRAAERRAQEESARREAEFERRRSEELRQVNDELRAALARQRALQTELLRVSRTDPLTGLSNRRHLREQLDREVLRLVRRFRPLSLLLLDVDRFKDVNDLHGHDVGDAVLVELGARLRAAVRAIDPVGRWGGEEFCVALFETDLGEALVPAEHLRAAIASTPVQTRVGPLSLTVSIGVAALAPQAPDLDEALRRADQALYQAKARGRNCVVVSEI